jgi:hypothetical protein
MKQETTWRQADGLPPPNDPLCESQKCLGATGIPLYVLYWKIWKMICGSKPENMMFDIYFLENDSCSKPWGQKSTVSTIFFLT